MEVRLYNKGILSNLWRQNKGIHIKRNSCMLYTIYFEVCTICAYISDSLWIEIYGVQSIVLYDTSGYSKFWSISYYGENITNCRAALEWAFGEAEGGISEVLPLQLEHNEFFVTVSSPDYFQVIVGLVISCASHRGHEVGEKLLCFNGNTWESATMQVNMQSELNVSLKFLWI